MFLVNYYSNSSLGNETYGWTFYAGHPYIESTIALSDNHTAMIIAIVFV